MNKLTKILKPLAIGYFWVCLSALILPPVVALMYYACSEKETYLVKTSLDGKFIAKLYGGIYQVKFVGDHPDPFVLNGIYVQRKGSQQKWLVAQQNDQHKFLTARKIDVVWLPDDSLVIETNDGFALSVKELTVDGRKIKVSLANVGYK